jgi:hypothetical protein
MSDEPGLSLEAQRDLVRKIVQLAGKLEDGGDPYMRAQYMHLKERAEALYSVLELEEGALSPD